MTKIRILHIPTGEFEDIDKEDVEKGLKTNPHMSLFYYCRMKACSAYKNPCGINCHECPWDRFSGVIHYEIEYDIQEIE